MYEKHRIGIIGESIACGYLRNNSYSIQMRNFKCRQGEIDIIAFDETLKEIVFLEVKTRTSFYYGFPSDAVDKKKQINMLNSAKYYLFKNRLYDVCIRFDVIEVVLNKGKYKLNHLKNVIS